MVSDYMSAILKILPRTQKWPYPKKYFTTRAQTSDLFFLMKLEDLVVKWRKSKTNVRGALWILVDLTWNDPTSFRTWFMIHYPPPIETWFKTLQFFFEFKALVVGKLMTWFTQSNSCSKGVVSRLYICKRWRQTLTCVMTAPTKS